MSEYLTPSRAEDAIAAADNFLYSHRGATLDGHAASVQVTENVLRQEEYAKDILTSVQHPDYDGLYVPLSNYNADEYDKVKTALANYFVLVPSSMLERGPSVFYPAVVSEDSLVARHLRLHVLRQPYRRHIRYGTSTILSAAGQSETRGVGEHRRGMSEGVEAEHFATLLGTANDARLQAAWQAGKHVNHSWRKAADTSVTSELASRVFGRDIPQATITVTKQDVQTGRALLLWHEGMLDEYTGAPEAATKDKALLVIQGLGFEAVRRSSPQALQSIRRLLA